MSESITLSVQIRSKASKVYKFASNPANLPKWAKAFALSAKKENGKWKLDTPIGKAGVEFAPKNRFGVLDHTV